MARHLHIPSPTDSISFTIPLGVLKFHSANSFKSCLTYTFEGVTIQMCAFVTEDTNFPN